MKTTNVTLIRFGLLVKLFFLFLLLTLAATSFGQVVPELQFMNPVLVSGTAGQNGAIYRFSNVAAGVDAEVEIKGRSSAAVELSSIDTVGAGLGYTKAFQPVIGIPGVAPANTTWSMDFELTFYKAGSNARQTIQQFSATGLDIDGDGGTLYEWAQMKKVSHIDTALVNRLNILKTGSAGDGDDYSVTGVVANAVGIDTNATYVMANYQYTNKSKIQFTIGATTLGGTTNAAMRLNSIWFRQFTNPALPLTWINFTTALKSSKVELKWSTTAEVNVSHFVIEKSTDGKNFSEVALVFAIDKAEGINNYEYNDVAGKDAAVIYYRLRSVDVDGKSQLSETRIIHTGLAASTSLNLSTYPNPVANELRVTLPAAWQNKALVIEIYSAAGQALQRKQVAVASQTELIATNKLSPGIYVVRVVCGTQVAQQKIVKQ